MLTLPTSQTRPLRACRMTIEDQLDLAHLLAAKYVRSDAGSVGRTLTITKEEYWHIDGRLIVIIPRWMSDMIAEAQEWALDILLPISPTGQVSPAEIQQYLSSISPEMLAWCTMREYIAKRWSARQK